MFDCVLCPKLCPVDLLSGCLLSCCLLNRCTAVRVTSSDARGVILSSQSPLTLSSCIQERTGFPHGFPWCVSFTMPFPILPLKFAHDDAEKLRGTYCTLCGVRCHTLCRCELTPSPRVCTVSLEELYLGTTKRFNIQRKVCLMP